MISDPQTNTVYFSNHLLADYPRQFQKLSDIITSSGYKVKFLEGTEDYYCRDYMPVQVSETDFVQFVFRPEAYLKDEELNFISNPVYVGLMTPGLIRPRYSPLILDGGNIIKWENKVIITDRVLKDNRYQFPSFEAIIERLKFDLKCEIIIIPGYPEEDTGHADGMIRFIDTNTVFINEASPNYPDWESDFRKILTDKYKLKIVELICDIEEYDNTAEGLYLNYLHVGQLIIVPQFGYKPSDNKALATINEHFGKTHQVVPLKANWLAKNAGVFNCASWTVKE
jgi:agmatine deiminase